MRRRVLSAGRRTIPDPFPTTLPFGNLAVSSDLGGGTWTQIFANDFDYNVPIGGIVPNSLGTALVPGSYAEVNTDIDDWGYFYADNTDSSWGEKTSLLMPSEAGYIAPGNPGYPATYLSHAKWYPGKTVKFADSCFQVHFHAEELNNDGIMYGLGAALSIRNPLNTSQSRLGPFLRYQYRMIHTDQLGLTPGQTSYWTSVPLAIDSLNWPSNGEFDWTECDSNKTVEGNYHPAYTSNETWHVSGGGASALDWHTFTVEWSPTRVKFWCDDVLCWNTTDRIPQGPMQIVLQHEQNWRAGVGSATAKIDWLSIWALT